MSYSTSLFWLEMAVLIGCVAFSIRMRSKPAMWVALWIVAHCAVWLALHDEENLVKLIACALVYLGLLKTFPHAARWWQCEGGALAGPFLLATSAFFLFMSVADRWIVLGLSIGAMLAFMASCLLIGFWVVYRWTEPAESTEGSLHR